MNEMIQQPETIVEEGITLSQLIKIVWNNITLVFLVTFWVTVFGIVLTFFIIKPEYTAETSIMVQVDSEDAGVNEQSAISIAQGLMATYKDFVVSNTVLNSVIADVDGLEPSDLVALKNSITVSSTTSVLIIYIKVVNGSNEMAAEIANQLVENSILLANDPESNFLFLQNKLRLLDPATIPGAPSAPNKVLNVVISFLIGVILSLGIVFVKELFNNKFQSASEMEKYLNINVIASVPGSIKERKLVD
jgi:capsular polysaccharide biosynthesis protein